MTLALSLEVTRNLGVAALAGLAVGIEREWSGHASGPAARFAGARTFFLLGLLGGVAGWLATGGLGALAVLLMAGGIALTVVAYAMAARRSPADIEGTTEVAALAVLALAAVAGLGFPLLTGAAVSVIVLVLVEKSRIQQLVRRIGEREMGAALQFAVLALVILPLLPEGPYGPFDSIRPRALWAVVLLFSGLSFAGYLARHAVGATRGYAVTGLLGGVVSSTAVTLDFARHSRSEPVLSSAFALGVIGASTMLLPRVLLLGAVLSPAFAWASLGYLLPALLVGGTIVAITLLRAPRHPENHPAEMRSPLGLGSAVKMAVGFQVVLLLVPLVQKVWGAPGVLGSAVLLGISDMDALTLSMAKLADSPASVALAAQALGIGALASTLFKLGLVLALGSGPFRRRAAAGLAGLAVACSLGLWLARSSDATALGQRHGLPIPSTSTFQP
jgi:uncharacterized membrane protein (DUF4010 family)